MRFRIAVAWIALNLIMARAIDLKLPISDSKLLGLQVRNYGKITENKMTKVYEGYDGDIIENVYMRGKVFYKPKKGQKALGRKVYLEISDKYILACVESRYVGWIELKHYKIKGERAKEIEYEEFIKTLSTNKQY